MVGFHRRLFELDAQFVREQDDGVIVLGGSIYGAQGVIFNHPRTPCEAMLAVWFSNPIGCDPVDRSRHPNCLLERRGANLKTLSLVGLVGDGEVGGWEGWVVYGHVTEVEA
mgnify:CR=1 FL=1